MDLAEEIYDSLIGERITPIPGVQNAFADGSSCAKWYEEMDAACESLRRRLGVPDEDADLETILCCQLLIQRTLCVEMFRLGHRMG